MDKIDIGELADEFGRERAVSIAVDQLGMTEEYARFSIAIALGEIDGDLIPVDNEESNA